VILPPQPVVCPADGEEMLLLTDGYWCPKCRHLYPSGVKHTERVLLTVREGF
jgi:hypothetical protein